MASSDSLTIRRGVNFDAYFDSYIDATNTTRIDYDGWRFTVSLAVDGQDDPTWSTDDIDPALTLVTTDAEGNPLSPPGKRLALHLDATATTALTSGGALTLLRIDPAFPANVQLIAGPVPVNLARQP